MKQLIDKINEHDQRVQNLKQKLAEADQEIILGDARSLEDSMALIMINAYRIRSGGEWSTPETIKLLSEMKLSEERNIDSRKNRLRDRPDLIKQAEVNAKQQYKEFVKAFDELRKKK
jgi:predicted transcriptional regulator YheO